MTTLSLPCANCTPNDTGCRNAGKSSCKNCQLVVYCGLDCQEAHWPIHKIDCKSALNKATWTPDWVQKNRTPTFIGGGIGVQFGGRKYLWGNVPALDILSLASNEGEGYRGKLSLLFAASGDLRNVVKTMAQLPASYNRPIKITMNDRDLDIVARNAIMLLVAFTAESQDEVIGCVIHIWYSAFIRMYDLNILRQRIRPLIENVCDKIKEKPANSVLGKTWTFGRRSLRLVLEKSTWDRLSSFTEVPEGLTMEKGNEIRTAVTLADPRVDYRDRHFLFLTPSHRVARHRFRQDGLLLPFGAPRSEFRQPNPTFFQNAEAWPMHDNADPLNGWSVKEVEMTPTGLATSDIYGKLFYCVRSALKVFLDRTSTMSMTFQLFHLDASDLPAYLENESFDRIEVSNISDGGYLGIRRTVGQFSTLLHPPSTNPYATLITLFMNIVDENMTDQDRIADATMESPSTKRLLKFLPPDHSPISHHDPDIIKFTYARDFVRTYDHIFERLVGGILYLWHRLDELYSNFVVRAANMFEFSRFPQFLGMAMKEKHTIIEKWAFRLKLEPEQKGAKEEFDLLMRGGVTGKERYMEWKRISE